MEFSESTTSWKTSTSRKRERITFLQMQRSPTFRTSRTTKLKFLNPADHYHDYFHKSNKKHNRKYIAGYGSGPFINMQHNKAQIAKK